MLFLYLLGSVLTYQEELHVYINRLFPLLAENQLNYLLSSLFSVVEDSVSTPLEYFISFGFLYIALTNKV